MEDAATTTARDEPRRVLVIDDEYGARLQVELALANSSVARVVATAGNGARGAELAEELRPDLIVLDLRMPVMDGFEALPLLKRFCPDARIFIRSSSDQEECERQAMELGAHGFIPKFMAFDDLREVLERAALDAAAARRLLHDLLLQPRLRRRPAVSPRLQRTIGRPLAGSPKSGASSS